MIIKSKKIKDVIFFKNTSFKDNRGYFKELLKEKNLLTYTENENNTFSTPFQKKSKFFK